MSKLGPYEQHLDPPEDGSPWYEPCPDCDGTGARSEGPEGEYLCSLVECESCDGKGEIRIDP